MEHPLPSKSAPAVGPGLRPIPPGSPAYRKPYVSPAGVRVSYEEDFTKQHYLECDGVCLHFYQMLQNKVVGREHANEPVCIPESVVFEHNFPQAWFSYDEENHELIKRPGKMLDAATMYEFFSVPCPGAGPSGSAVVAQFLHVSVPVETEWKDVMTRKEKKENVYAGQHVTYVEFFTASTLNDFLFGQHRKPNGVLQRFVLPKGQGMSRKNMQIQMMWTPAMTTAHMRVNRYRLDDAMVAFSDRLSTYDGAPHLSQELIVADETKNSLNEICKGIADHFHRTEKKRLSRLLLYFKTDDMNRLWLMWCGGLRVEPDALSPNFQRVPLMLHMRKEILDANTTTIHRLQNRRRRQKQLLALDYELYEMTKDSQFAIAINSTHRRQARALHLRGIRHVQLREGHADPRRNPNHPLHESFLRICDDSDLRVRPDQLGRSRSQEFAEERSRTSGRHVSPHLLDSDLDAEATTEMVRLELIALAMDAWYGMYSSTLSQHPNLMSTSQMVIAPPLGQQGCLLPAEQEALLQILSLTPAASGPQRPTADPQAWERYRAANGVLSNARRLDRPSAQVQCEVEGFFDQIFQLRGSEIVEKCLLDFGTFFED